MEQYIIRQAEELLEKHFELLANRISPKDGADPIEFMAFKEKMFKPPAIDAAIVTCDSILISLVHTREHHEEWDRIEKIKSYLKGLL